MLVTLILYTLTTLAHASNLWCKKHYNMKWGSQNLTCKMQRAEQAWTRAEMRMRRTDMWESKTETRQNNQIIERKKETYSINEKEMKRKSKEKDWIWKQEHNERQTKLRKDFKVSGSPSAPLLPSRYDWHVSASCLNLAERERDIWKHMMSGTSYVDCEKM